VAAPTWQSTTVTDFTSDATTHDADMPATVDSGDLLLAVAAFDGSSTTITTPSGWTKVIETGRADAISGVYAKVADGSEDSTTVDFVTSNSQMGSVHVLRITGWQGTLAGIRAAAGFGDGNPVGIALYAGASVDYLWVLAQAKSSSGTFGTVPSGYSNENKSNVTQNDTARAAIASATKASTAVSESVTPLWIATATAVVFLVAVLPA
jgi:hypothetical protein